MKLTILINNVKYETKKNVVNAMETMQNNIMSISPAKGEKK